jgi:hypothetical protein
MNANVLKSLPAPSTLLAQAQRKCFELLVDVSMRKPKKSLSLAKKAQCAGSNSGVISTGECNTFWHSPEV